MTITLTREEAQQVLNAIHFYSDGDEVDMKLIGMLRTRLAQPEPEPVAYRVWGRMGSISFRHTKPHESEYVEWDELYPAPPQREWQGLTDEERYLGDARSDQEIEYAKTIEAKLKEKNS
jgi:hypothetical protein